MRVKKVAVLGGLLLLASAMHAGTAAAAAQPGAELTLTVGTSASGDAATARLTCDPDGGTHPSPREACDLLRSVDGEIGLLRRSPGTACTREYAPRLASARGVWRRTKQFAVTRTYSNRCEMLATTGVLFEFAR